MINLNKLLLLLFIGVTFSTPRTIHVFVSLCDAKSQGISDYNRESADGNNPYHNQYWGALYGIEQYFNKSDNWKEIPTSIIRHNGCESEILDRIIFKHTKENVYLVADAYSGNRRSSQATNDIFRGLSGHCKSTMTINDTLLGLDGNADLLVYVGHHFYGATNYIDNHNSEDDIARDVILLACESREMCRSINKAKGNPVLLTKQLMAPEAYVLENVFEGWIANEGSDSIRLRAAKAYSEYQGCSLNAALGVFTTSCEK